MDEPIHPDELADIKELKRLLPKLSCLTDQQVFNMYEQYSQHMYASWVAGPDSIWFDKWIREKGLYPTCGHDHGQT